MIYHECKQTFVGRYMNYVAGRQAGSQTNDAILLPICRKLSLQDSISFSALKLDDKRMLNHNQTKE